MKIYVGVAQSQEWVHSQFMWSLLGAITNAGYELCVVREDHAWDEVRNNIMIQKFLDSDCDILAKCDADQVYPVDYFRTMVPLVEKYPVIGPIIFDRSPDSGYASLCCGDKLAVRTSGFDLLNVSGVCEFEYTHTNNFYAREVLEAIDPPWYKREMSENGQQYTNHVDYDFLDKIKAAGYTIAVNCDVVVGHLIYMPLTKESVHRLRGR